MKQSCSTLRNRTATFSTTPDPFRVVELIRVRDFNKVISLFIRKTKRSLQLWSLSSLIIRIRPLLRAQRDTLRAGGNVTHVKK